MLLYYGTTKENANDIKINGFSFSTTDKAICFTNDYEKAKRIALKEMAGIRLEKEIEVRRLNDALINARLSSIEQTFEAKRNQIEKKINMVSEPRILRMYNSQLLNMEAKHVSDQKELEEKRSFSVTFSLRFSGQVKFVSNP